MASIVVLKAKASPSFTKQLFDRLVLNDKQPQSVAHVQRTLRTVVIVLINAVHEKKLSKKQFSQLFAQLRATAVGVYLNHIVEAPDLIEHISPFLPTDVLISVGCPDIEFCGVKRAVQYIKRIANKISPSLYDDSPHEQNENKWIQLLAEVVETVLNRIEIGSEIGDGDETEVSMQGLDGKAFIAAVSQDQPTLMVLEYLRDSHYCQFEELLAHIGPSWEGVSRHRLEIDFDYFHGHLSERDGRGLDGLFEDDWRDALKPEDIYRIRNGDDV